MNGDLIALPVALVVLGYHYGITRDVRRTMHRIAAALEALSPDDYGLDEDDGPHLG